MIKNNALSDKLNDFRKKQGPAENTPPNLPRATISILEKITAIYAFLVIVFKSIVYGYSSKIIFSTDWNFFEALCVGMGITLVMGFLIDIIRPSKE